MRNVILSKGDLFLPGIAKIIIDIIRVAHKTFIWFLIIQPVCSEYLSARLLLTRA